MKKLTKLFALLFMVLTVATSLLASACADSSTSSIGEHVCEYVQTTIKPATCTEDGREGLVCTYCGDVYESHVVLATGHDFGDWYQTKPATCKEEGELYKDCKNCDFFDTRMIPVVDHDYTYYVQVIDEATCTQEGLGMGNCSCGAKKEVVLEKLEHEYEDGFCLNCRLPEETDKE